VKKVTWLNGLFNTSLYDDYPVCTSGTQRKFGESWQSPTENNVPGTNLCRPDEGLSAKCADFWLSGRHVADMSATFPAKVVDFMSKELIVFYFETQN